MTAKAALAQALLDGHVLSIKNCFHMIGLTNAPREISRMIEQPFGVVVSRTKKEGKSKYGQSVMWYEYRLNNTEYNKEGIQKMREYVRQQKAGTIYKTDKQVKDAKQMSLL